MAERKNCSISLWGNYAPMRITRVPDSTPSPAIAPDIALAVTPRAKGLFASARGKPTILDPAGGRAYFPPLYAADYLGPIMVLAMGAVPTAYALYRAALSRAQ